ncbi:MAG: cyclic nucleotide-binding domain-containing protein [Elusimicrobia bacterium]|nr:cyclic nucleotide-binding domain-containing protein [Elusimicrobiota bacterium]
MPEGPVRVAVDDACARLLAGALELGDFFAEFAAEHVEKLFPRSGLYDYPDGWRLIGQGERGRDMFVICSGGAAVHQSCGSAAAELARLGPGDILGEIALVGGGLRTANVLVEGPSRIFRLAFADMPYLLKHHPRLEAHLRALAARRLR